MTKDEIERLARDFFDAIEAGDIGKVRDTYATDAVIWHNFDGKESTREGNLATLDGFIKAVPTRRYTQRRVNVFEDGFVQRHLLVGTLANGKEVSLAACVICAVRDGRISRLDEYFDSAALATWRDDS
jgi:ketosteroid isomerase-like protein